MITAIVVAIVTGGHAPMLEIMVGTLVLVPIVLIVVSDRDDAKARRRLEAAHTDEAERDLLAGQSSVTTSLGAPGD